MPTRRFLVPALPTRAVVGACAAGCVVGATAVYRLDLAVALVVIVSCVIGALLVRDPSSILHVLVVVLFAESLSVGPLSLGRVVALGALVAVAVRRAVSSWRPRALPMWSWVPIALFVGWAWASGLWASIPTAWGFAMGQLGLAICFYLAFALLLSSVAQLRPLLLTYSAVAVVAAVIGCVQLGLGAARATGLQGDPNIYAIYQVAAIPVIVVLARTPGRVRRSWWWLALALVSLSVIASGSRGGLVGAVATALFLIVRRGRGPHRNLGRLVISGVALLGLLVVASTTLNHRLDPSRVARDRASGRIDIWYVASRSVERHPLLGVGGGNFKPRSVSLLETTPGVGLTKSHLLESNGIEVHNVYLETLTEYGIAGGALWLVLLATTFAGLLAGERRLSSSGPVTALLPMMVAFMTAAAFVSVVNSKLLWMLVGLAAALQTAPLRAPSPALEPLPR